MLDCRQSQAVLLSHSTNHSSVGSLGSIGEVTYVPDDFHMAFFLIIHLPAFLPKSISTYFFLYSTCPSSFSVSLSLSLFISLSFPFSLCLCLSLCLSLCDFLSLFLFHCILSRITFIHIVFLYLLSSQAEDMAVDDADDETDNVSLRSAHTGITNRTSNSAPCLVPGTDDVITSGKIK